MRIKKILFGIMMVAALLILARPSISIADTYSGAWLPNDLDIFAIELTQEEETSDSFYMYDWGNQGTDLCLFTDGIYNSTTVYFTQDGGDWWAGLTQDAQTLSLGDTTEFGFYFSDGTNYYSYLLTVPDPGEVYTLYDDNTGMTVMVSDAAPVPITTSALLFGSGIIGFIAIGRVRRRDS